MVFDLLCAPIWPRRQTIINQRLGSMKQRLKKWPLKFALNHIFSYQIILEFTVPALHGRLHPGYHYQMSLKMFSFYLIFFYSPCFACNINGYFFFLLQKFLTIFWVFLQYKACFFYYIFKMKNLHRLRDINGELKFISENIILERTRGLLPFECHQMLI